ncbi:hypothetical protein E2C01_058312 [Portunus trituberculatus]|uniref:Uncharacterized protein n=1 Tax=Portunus trituberculatus TaxID=210409 RepID=A0A5B7GV98_PORTR|nr:hypothetical protein [Portunus trituberculatus]
MYAVCSHLDEERKPRPRPASPLSHLPLSCTLHNSHQQSTPMDILRLYTFITFPQCGLPAGKDGVTGVDVTVTECSWVACGRQQIVLEGVLVPHPGSRGSRRCGGDMRSVSVVAGGWSEEVVCLKTWSGEVSREEGAAPPPQHYTAVITATLNRQGLRLSPEVYYISGAKEWACGQDIKQHTEQWRPLIRYEDCFHVTGIINC